MRSSSCAWPASTASGRSPRASCARQTASSKPPTAASGRRAGRSACTRPYRHSDPTRYVDGRTRAAATHLELYQDAAGLCGGGAAGAGAEDDLGRGGVLVVWVGVAADHRTLDLAESLSNREPMTAVSHREPTSRQTTTQRRHREHRNANEQQGGSGMRMGARQMRDIRFDSTGVARPKQRRDGRHKDSTLDRQITAIRQSPKVSLIRRFEDSKIRLWRGGGGPATGGRPSRHGCARQLDPGRCWRATADAGRGRGRRQSK